MFAKRDTNIWKVALLALILDRLLWPLGSMAASGSGVSSIFASLTAFAKTFVDDLGVYIVRYVGLVLMISLFRWARVMIHRIAPGGAAHA